LRTRLSPAKFHGIKGQLVANSHIHASMPPRTSKPPPAEGPVATKDAEEPTDAKEPARPSKKEPMVARDPVRASTKAKGPMSSSTMHFAALSVAAELPQLPPPDGRAPSTATFDMIGVDLCVVNALRRAIMADVLTAAVAFNPTSPGENAKSGITFHRNTSVLHNEFLGHRVSLVPIGLDENQLHGFDPANYTFVLKTKNVGDEIVNVTTADFKVLDVTGAALKQADRDAIFPPSPVTGDHVLLARLKPSPLNDGNGEELHLECRARLGSGREHSRWSPVSTCFFRNKVDPAAFEATLAVRAATAAKVAGVGRLDTAAAAALRVQHAAMEGMRSFLKNEHGEPAAFEFTIKSETRLRPTYLVFEGMRVLAEKVRRLSRGLRHEAERNSEASWDAAGAPELDARHAAEVRVDVLANMDDFYEVAVQGEDHTLGNLVQGLLYRHWLRDGAAAVVSFVGYHQPHPLEEQIVFKIKCAKAGDDLRARLAEGLDWVLEQLDDLTAEWVAFAGLPRTMASVDAAMRRRETMGRVGIAKAR
jgi:DNA-directed RNA polymerase subunit L